MMTPETEKVLKSMFDELKNPRTNPSQVSAMALTVIAGALLEINRKLVASKRTL